MFVSGELHVIGVRHHSPACARLVALEIRRLRPRHVLIEGPADMNERLGELLLEHELPIAIFTSYRGQDRVRASWSPLCEYSPELVALREGQAAGARVRFMDLPAWHPAFDGVRNRYSDGDRREARAIAELCARFSVEGLDGLWDHLFEQPAAEGELSERLKQYFLAVRGDAPAAGEDEPREAFMIAHLEAALADGGPVVAVCGGFHAPALARAAPVAGARFPEVPSPSSARSYLVPYSFRRLDAFTGYEAGMPSPAYYQAVWELGPAGAGDELTRAAVQSLRARGQPVSAADLIAASTMTQGLARLRGHQAPVRADLLDGLASALVKDSLDAPLPWSIRGPLAPGTDPMIAEVLRAFCGERRGRLAADTPLPPLLVDVRDVLGQLGLAPGGPGSEPRRVRAGLADPAGRARSAALHRLKLIGVPGFALESGPALPTDPVVEEEWSISFSEDFEAGVVEASGWGPTLEQAAAGRLEEVLADPELDLARLAILVAESFFAAVQPLSERATEMATARAGEEADLRRLGGALERMLGLYRHDVLLGARGSAQVGAVVAAAFDRGLWLLEHLAGASAPADDEQLRAVVAMRDALRHAGAALGLDAAHAVAVLERRLHAPDAPPAIRGASLGALWSLGRPPAGERPVERAILAAALPATFGDFLAGLFRLAREQVVREPGAMAALDGVVQQLTEQDFLIALPSLRLAFSYFPPAERAEIARGVLERRGRSELGVHQLLRPEVAPEVVVAGARLDEQVERVLARHGLLDTGDGGGDVVEGGDRGP